MSKPMIPWLHPHNFQFPNPSDALSEPNGLLAAGGDLSPSRLIKAYQNGIFPWFNEDDPILWWSPDPRCILHPDKIHISKSMKKVIRKGDFSFTFDHAFSDVIEACAGTRQETTGTWISPEIQAAYLKLHHLGVAHSVEVWREGSLIGGLYGLAMGKLFFGESMFSYQENASKIAFIALSRQLLEWGYPLIDCQIHNPHLQSLGAEHIPRSVFLDYIKSHIHQDRGHEWVFKLDAASLLS